jgi:hypothetical protein
LFTALSIRVDTLRRVPTPDEAINHLFRGRQVVFDIAQKKDVRTFILRSPLNPQAKCKEETER